MAGSPEEELRVDEADGMAYPMRDFVVQYGGSEESPPEQWLKARIAPSTWTGAAAGQETKVDAVPLNQATPAPQVWSGAATGSPDVESFIAEQQLDLRVATLLREQKPEAQAKIIAEGPMSNAVQPLTMMVARIKRAVGSERDTDEWNPDGGGKLTGVVHMWHEKKGYGFITDSGTGTQYFCHHIDIGGRSLIKGGTCTFDLGTNTNGKPKAMNITGAVGPRIGPNGEWGFDWRDTKGGKGGGGQDMPMMIGGPQARYMPMGGGRGMPMGGAGRGRVGDLGPSGKPLAVPLGGGGVGPSGNMLAVPLGGGDPSVIDTEIEHWVTLPGHWIPGQNVRFYINGTRYESPVPAGQTPGSTFTIHL